MAGQGGARTGDRNSRAAAKFLDLLALARRDDVPAVLAGVPTADLAAGLRRLGPLVPDLVLDHVLDHGPTAARLALADTARRFDTWQFEDDHRLSVWIGILARRLLRLFDPDVDEALFALGLPHGDRPGWVWVRRAVVRDRVGADGEPVVPPRLAAAIGERLRGMTGRLSRADRRLLEVLVEAADPAIAGPAAALLGRGPAPVAPRPEKSGPGYDEWLAHWDTPGTASSLYAPDWDDVLALTDEDHLLQEGWISGEQAWFPVRSVGLDEVIAREDVPPEVMDRIAECYRERLPPVWRPDLRAIRRFQTWGGVTAERQRLLAVQVARGLQQGSLTPREVLDHVRPGFAVVDVAQADWPLPGAEGTFRGRAELRALLARELDERLGGDVMRWAVLVMMIQYGWDSLTARIDAVLASERVLDRERQQGCWRPSALHAVLSPQNVLLSLARPEVAAGVIRLLPQRARDMLPHWPLSPALHDFAWTIPDGRLALAQLPWVSDGAKLKLIADPETHSQIMLVVLATHRGIEVRSAAMQRLLAEGTPWERVVEVAARYKPSGISLVFADQDDPARIARLLRAFPGLDAAERVRLYARVAELAGPEPVWAIELERAGVLDAMMPAVRDSMASGEAAPLARAVEETPLEVVSGPDEDPPWPSSGDRTPAAIAMSAFDGRPDRWLALAALLRRNRLPPDDAVVVRLMERVVAAHP